MKFTRIITCATLMLGASLVVSFTYLPKVEISKVEASINSTPPFEGQIIYDWIFKDKTGEMSDEEAKMLMGDQQIYTVKRDKYKATMNGMLAMKMYYLGGDTLYTEMQGVEALLWASAIEEEDEVVKFEITENVEKIAGVICHKLSIESKKGTMDYYYSPDYAVNPADYARHEYGFWKFCMEKTKTLPLKVVDIDDESFTQIVAKKIQPTEVSEATFELPQLSKVKMPE